MGRTLWALGLGVAATACRGDNTICYSSADARACFDLVLSDEVADVAYIYPEPPDAQYTRPVRYLDLLAADLSANVAPNFQLGELAQAEKGRYGIVQTHAVDRLQTLRDELGPIRVTSGYRSPGHNASIPGSATLSRHQYGDAFDLVATDTSLKTLAQACEANEASFVDTYETHVHCDWRLEALDPAFFGDVPSGPSNVPLDIGSVRALAPVQDADVVPVVVDEQVVLTAPATGWDEGEPLREWTAYDADGEVLEIRFGRTYVPPAHAVEVDVEIGLKLVRSVRL